MHIHIFVQFVGVITSPPPIYLYNYILFLFFVIDYGHACLHTIA